MIFTDKSKYYDFNLLKEKMTSNHDIETRATIEKNDIELFTTNSMHFMIDEETSILNTSKQKG